MFISSCSDINKNQSCLRHVGYTIILLIFLSGFSNFSYSSCINETGLSPSEIIIAANNKQIQISKNIKSKKAAKNAIPKLQECLKQKRKFEKILKQITLEETKKLAQVASQYLFQPIKDYSDSAPIPTSLSYDPIPPKNCKPEIAAWHAQRKKTGFADTLWSFRINPRHSGFRSIENKEEYLRFSKALVMWSKLELMIQTGTVQPHQGTHTQLVHLRQDGVFGLSWSPTYTIMENHGSVYFDGGKENSRMYYDPANRWVYEDGGRILLYWQNSKQAYSLEQATAKYESSTSTMISNYTLLAQILANLPRTHDRKFTVNKERMQRAQANGKKFIAAKNINSCKDFKTSSVAVTTKTKKTLAVKTAKPTIYREIGLHKVTTPVQRKKLLGSWRMDPAWVTGYFGVIDFYADGFLAPWFESPKKTIPSLSVLFPNNNKPVYAFGSMFDYWGVTSASPDSKPVNVAQLHGFVKLPTPKEAKSTRGYTIKKEFDDWQLLDNNILRISRRFYQVKINNNKLILQAYAVCKKNIKTITACIQNKIVIKTKKAKVPYWTFKRMAGKQLEEYKIYSTIELLKIIPAPKSDRFKIKSNTRTPDYVSLLKSSKHLADQAIPGYMIIDSVVPTWRGRNSTIVNRLSDKLQLAIKLGFGRWLLETKYKGKPVCEGYLGTLKQRVKMERDSKKILQAYCSNNDSKIIKSGTAISEKKKQSPAKKSTSVKPQNESKTRTLVGCWNWANGGYIVIDADGKARNGAVKASWKTINSATRRYLITWPPITDTLTLSANGRVLKGNNTFGLPISAKRKTGTGSNLFGSWLWNNGMTVDIHPDNTVSAGFFIGKLHKKDKSWIIEWPVDDAITLAPNGNSLDLKNQFGALKATRDKSCKKR